MKTRLSVNVNKIATLRNARGGNNPNILDLIKKIESYGAVNNIINMKFRGILTKDF